MDTFLLYNVSSNPNLNKTVDEDEEYFIHRDVIYMFVCSVAIIANIFLIYCLVRFKKMRTKRNLLVLNWAIADLLHLISNIFSFDLIPDTCGFSIYDQYFCGVFETRSMLQTATIIFAFLLLLDCVFLKHTKKWLIILVVCVWVVIYLSVIASIVLCIFGIYLPYSHASLLISFGVLLVAALVYSCLVIRRKVKKIEVEDSCFRYNAVGMYVLCWLPNWVCFYLSLFMGDQLLYNISKSAAIIGYMNVVINLFLFSFLDRNFKYCFSQAFRRNDGSADKKISYNENNDVEFLYTSLKPNPQIHPKPTQFTQPSRSILGTPV